MATLSEVSTPHRVGDHYEIEIAPGWRQGRGAFGGLVVGALVRAIEDHTADPRRRVRSVTAELPGPVEHGSVEISVDTLRAGKHVSTTRAALVQHGEIRAHAVAILGASRPGAAALAWNELVRPEAPPWPELAPAPLSGPGPWPEFAQHFEYRIVEGLPMAGGSGRALGWIRPRDPGPVRDAAYLAAMIDAWWPCALIRLPEMRPMATIAFTLDVVGDPGDLDPVAPLLYRASSPVCGDGYALETRELWTGDGRLAAINHQTFAIVK
jgi:acyl-CoA thioesterase